MTIFNFFDELKEVFSTHIPMFVILICSVVALITLIIILVLMKKKANNDTVVDNDELLIKQTLKETKKEMLLAQKNEKEAKEKETKEVEQNLVEENPAKNEEKPEAKDEISTEVKEESFVSRGKKKTSKQEEKPIEVSEKPKEELPQEDNLEEAKPEKANTSRGKKNTVVKQVEEKPVEEKTVEEKPVEEEQVEKVKEPVEAVPSNQAENVNEKKTRKVYGKYVIYNDGQFFYFKLKASNGETLVRSDDYQTKEAAEKAIEAIKRNIQTGKIMISNDKHGLFQFYLTARNNRTLVISSNYNSEERAISASKSFKRFAIDSIVDEEVKTAVSQKEVINMSNIEDKQGGKIGVIPVDNGFIYVLKASNGELLAKSDAYKTIVSAQNGLKRFINAVTSGTFYVTKDKKGYYQYVLYSSNGRLVEMGESYSSKALAISSAISVCSFIKQATNIEKN